MLIKIEKNLLCFADIPVRPNKKIHLDPLNNLKHVMKHMNFNIAFLHSSLGSGWILVLIFFTETEDIHLFIILPLVCQVMNSVRKLFKLYVAAN